MDFREVNYTVSDGVATLTLNRPEMLNALTTTMVAEWATAIEAAKNDSDVRVLVVTGNGRAFCAGADLRWLTDLPDSATGLRDQLRNGVQRIPRALATFDKPYIASINGVAMGAGLDQCCMADIRIASDQAKFSINHVRAGAVSGDGGYYYLTRLLGVSKALELVLKCDVLDAAEAYRIGLVNAVVPQEDLASATQDLAQKLAKGAPIAMQLAKRLIHQAVDISLDQHLDDATMASIVVANTVDFREGPRALMEKRTPRFLGK